MVGTSIFFQEVEYSGGGIPLLWKIASKWIWISVTADRFLVYLHASFFFGSYALLVSGKWRIESRNDFIELYLSLSSWYISMNLKDFFSFFFMLKPSRPENFSGIQFCSKLIIQTTNLHHTFVKEDTCRRGSILSFERELVREVSYHKSCKYLMNDKSSCSFTTSMYIFICMYVWKWKWSYLKTSQYIYGREVTAVD